MSEQDRAAIEAAMRSDPLAIARAEGHLEQGLMILSEQIGLGATANLVAAILKRLDGQMPSRRPH